MYLFSVFSQLTSDAWLGLSVVCFFPRSGENASYRVLSFQPEVFRR